jgi:hypothetical protein
MVVMITGHLTIAAVSDSTRLSAKTVPHGLAATTFFGGSFDLKRRSGYAPDEVHRELCALDV